MIFIIAAEYRLHVLQIRLVLGLFEALLQW